MTDRYMQLTVGGNSLLFIAQAINEDLDRDLFEMPLPYIQDKLTYDQISTQGDIMVTAMVKCGSGQPYASTKAARAAALLLLPDVEQTNVSLQAGDWNGAVFTQNTAYIYNLPDSGKELYVRKITPNLVLDKLDFLLFTITLTQGAKLI